MQSSNNIIIIYNVLLITAAKSISSLLKLVSITYYKSTIAFYCAFIFCTEFGSFLWFTSFLYLSFKHIPDFIQDHCEIKVLDFCHFCYSIFSHLSNWSSKNIKLCFDCLLKIQIKNYVMLYHSQFISETAHYYKYIKNLNSFIF